MKALSPVRILVVLGVLAVLASIGALFLVVQASNGPIAGGVGPASVHQPAAAQQPAAAPTAVLKKLTLVPAKSTVGGEIRVTAEGLPPNQPVELIWKTMKGGWVIEDYYHFRGKTFTNTQSILTTAVVGPDGRLDTHFTIPEDYGGVHDVQVAVGGGPLAQGGVEVVQTFEMSPTSGPVGTVIEVRGKGLGWRTMESTWVVNWDNQEVGWVSAVNTRGTAVARFRATGPGGEHMVKVYSGYMGQSYLNYEQAPNAYLPRPQFTFHLTPGAAANLTFAEPHQPQVIPHATNPGGAQLAINPTQGPVETQAVLRGTGFPPNTSVTLVWDTWVGSRVSGNGYAEQEKPLGTLQIDGSGALNAPVTIPADLGGLHAVVIKAGDQVLARTSFVIETSIVSISPTSGPAGTKVTIHFKGVGWTEYDNILVATYDNAYMGYVCGFNSQGDVVVNFTAAGASGVHLIDFYPGIYQGPAEGQQLYRLPQLTYADDHPGNKIPAFHFAFEITK